MRNSDKPTSRPAAATVGRSCFEVEPRASLGARMKLQDRATAAVPWALAESVLNAATGLLSTLVIGHLIEPRELGRAGAALAVVILVEIGSALGIGEALVRSRSIHTSLTDSAFAGLLGLSIVGMSICCALAAPMAWIYHDRNVGFLIASGSLLVPLSAIDIVPVAILTRKMRLDVLAKRGIVSKLATLVTAAALAYAGLGAWSILGSTFVGSALASLSLLRALQRWPKLRVDRAELRALIAFGGPISLELLMVGVTTRVFSLLFGIFHGLTNLGYLQFAQRLIDEIANLIQGVAFRFGLSYFASIERAGGSFLSAFLLGSKIVTFIGAPVLLGLAAISPDALDAIIGSRWLPATNFIIVAAVCWSLALPSVLLSSALRARGLQKPLVITSLLSCGLSLCACMLTAESTLLVAAIASGSRQFLGLPSALWMANRYLQVSPRRFVATFAGPLGSAIVMGLLVWALRDHVMQTSALDRLCVCVLAGFGLYTSLIMALDREPLGALQPFVFGLVRSAAGARAR